MFFDFYKMEKGAKASGKWSKRENDIIQAVLDHVSPEDDFNASLLNLKLQAWQEVRLK